MRIEPDIANRVQQIRARFTNRDAMMWKVGLVRAGNLHMITPAHFSDEWPQSMIANMIDVVAHDVAESIAPLPALNCSSGRMRTDADKQRAGKKNKGGQWYWRESGLKIHMLAGADRYVTDAFLPMYVGPDFGRKMPVIRIEDGLGCYYDLDADGCTQVAVKTWRDRVSRLAALFADDPDVHRGLMTDGYGREVRQDIELEVVRYCDTTETILYAPGKQNLVLCRYPNPVPGICPYFIAERPKLRQTGVPRGQFDDVIYTQIARAVMAQLTMEAGKKSVQAPTVVPMDLVDLPIGSDAIWRTEQGAGAVGKVRLDVPRDAFALGEQLDTELRSGARYPGVRSGQVEASIVTGRGVQQLSAGFETQIDAAQTILGETLRKATSYAFQLDETLWPHETRIIDGTLSGETFHEEWTPAKDVAGNYTCDVTYGFAAGLSPAQKVVMLLQLRADGDIDRDTLRRQLPWDIDVEQMQRQMDVQAIRDAGIGAVQAALAGVGQLAAMGQDPGPLLAAAAKVIKGRQDGKALEDLLEDAFAPPPAPEAPPGAEPAAAAGQPPAPPGPGQPGGPGIQELMAGLRSGTPAMSATVTRQQPAA